MNPSKFKMIFKFGVTVIVAVAIIIYFIGQGNVEKAQVQIDKLASDKLHNEKINTISKLNIENQSTEKQKEIDILDPKIKPHDIRSDKSSKSSIKSVIHLCVVSCDRYEETTILIKSVLLFTKSHVVFHIFTDKEQHQQYLDYFEFLPQSFRSHIDYNLYQLSFPSDQNAKEWKKLFKPCASQRLFIPNILTNIDSLIYVDTDVLFLSPIEELQSYFSQFNSSHVAALSPESEDTATGWYNRFARHPYYEPLGLNSGVMLMNLTRLRQTEWLPLIKQYYNKYSLKLTWGDQDLINIYFHYFREQVLILPCEYNYRQDHCMYMSVCKTAEKHGVQILHGSRRVFFNEKQPALKAIYQVVKEHKFSSSVKYSLVSKMKERMKNSMPSNCGKVAHIFTSAMERYATDF